MPGLVGGFGKHNNLFLTVRQSEFLGKFKFPPRLRSNSDTGRASVAVKEEKKKLTLKLTAVAGCYAHNNAVVDLIADSGPRSGSSFAAERYAERDSTTNLISKIGPYLAGLIEGDGTFAVHNTNSTIKKYSPKIIIVFKKADLPLANYLRELTNCGRVFIKQDRGYVLWQIQDLVSVFTIITIINGFMRTPKIEAMHRTID
jgi:hypothetical protein